MQFTSFSEVSEAVELFGNLGYTMALRPYDFKAYLRKTCGLNLKINQYKVVFRYNRFEDTVYIIFYHWDDKVTTIKLYRSVDNGGQILQEVQR